MADKGDQGAQVSGEDLTSFSNPNYHLSGSSDNRLPLASIGQAAEVDKGASDDRGDFPSSGSVDDLMFSQLKFSGEVQGDMEEPGERPENRSSLSQFIARVSSDHPRQPVDETAGIDDIASCGVHSGNSRRSENGPGDEQQDGEDSTGPVTLPPGWEQHTDGGGVYYWHVRTGVIQREVPEWGDQASPTQSTSESSAGDRRSSSGDQCDKEEKDKEMAMHVRFAVRSLGWVKISEDDLTPERSSKAVNRCIVELSRGRTDINDSVGCWGEGKDLCMDLDERNLTLLEPDTLAVLNTQPIASIRVWGVGRDNGRDFAYVARDRATKQHMCHVFRCDTPARQIANALRDVCRLIMSRRADAKAQQETTPPPAAAAAARPSQLPVRAQQDVQASYVVSFPTPLEEPRKSLHCQYLGPLTVDKPTGVDVLNGAIERLFEDTRPAEWRQVSVAVAPSTITVTDAADRDTVLLECRMRYLSFMGIAGNNVKLCAFIRHTAQNTFQAHVFHSDPSAGALCKTIEAACKLRYQKCLDSHAGGGGAGGNSASTPPPLTPTSSSPSSRSLGASLKHGVQNIVGLLKGKKDSS